MSNRKSNSDTSFFENKRYLTLAIIGAIIILAALAVIRFGDTWFSPEPVRPEGVGEIGSEHVHAAFSVILDWTFVDFDPIRYSKNAFANDYIFMMGDGSYNIIHRHASGATLGMFFDSLGMKYVGECFILPEGTKNGRGEPFERLEFCDEGDKKLKMYVNGKLNEDNENYIIQDNGQILIAYDEKNKPERGYSIG